MSHFLNFKFYNLKESIIGIPIESQEQQDKYKISILLLKDEYNNQLLSFLSKIIKAIGLDISKECNIREFKREDMINISKIIKSDNSTHLIVFGISPSQIDTQVSLRVNNWNYFDNHSILFTNKLIDIENNIKYKRIFWQELKQEFNDK